MTVVLVICGLVVLAGWAYVSHHSKRHGPAVVAWRFLSGHSLDGQYRTNASWLHPATRVLHQSGNAVRWHHLPRLHRAGIRTGTLVLALAVAYGLLRARTVTLAVLGAVLVLLAVLGGWRAYRKLQRWRHHRTWVRPLHRALGPVVAQHPGVRAADWLAIEPDRSEVTVYLPAGFDGRRSRKELVESTVTAKLALEAPRPKWELEGPRPSVTFTSKPAPPRRVTLPAVAELLELAAETELVLGLGRGGEPVSVSLDSDSPHLALSMGSGAGKSTVGRLIAAQVLQRGGIVLVLDYKRISQSWARGLPGVAYAKTPGEIHHALLWLAGEIARRNEVADIAADIEGRVHANVGPRLLVLAEEMNATISRLRAYWRQVKAPADPDRSPAAEAMEDALFMGRQVRVHVLAVAQMLSARTSASGEARENIGVRMLGRYTRNNWRMLCPEVHPMPPSSNLPGRIQVVTGAQARETQVALLSGREARDMAGAGTVTPWPARIPGAPALGSVTAAGDGNTASGQGSVTGGPPGGEPGPDAISLSDAVELGILRTGLIAVRKARYRDPAFPQPAARHGLTHLYDPEQLAGWERGRPRAGTRTEEN